MRLFVSVLIVLLYNPPYAVAGGKESCEKGTCWFISKSVLGSDLKISASSLYAGAISSLTYRGHEFVNAYDNGREIQSASSFDDMGECFNPTEAGGSYDKGKKTSSKLLQISVEDDVLETTTDMAFWWAPQKRYLKPYKKYCGLRSDLKYAQNKTFTGNHILHKKVSIGYKGIDNVINYQAQFDVPEQHNTAVFEPVAVYLNPEFSVIEGFDTKSGRLVDLSKNSGAQTKPVILSTENGDYAMGIYSPNLPQGQRAYGRNKFPSTTKMNCVFREKTIAAKSYDYQCLLVVGNKDEVVDGIKRLIEVD